MEAAERIPRTCEGKRLMRILVAFTALLLFASNAFAAEISWMYVQHRKYESGRNLNRLAFGLIDEKGQLLTDGRDIANVQLYAPDGSTVNLLKYGFDSDEEIFGLYDSIKSRWHYNDHWQFDSWFIAEILDTLNPGIYWLKITTTDGKVTERTFAFNRRISLPIIDSASFQLQSDPNGNLIWTWKIPMELGQLALNHKTRARASIDIYKNDKIDIEFN